MTAIEVGEDLSQLDAAIEALPNLPAVFLLWPREGEPHLSKTALLRRRLLRLLKDREKPSRLLNLRHTVRRIEYQLTGSAFESSLVYYEQARRHFPDKYLEVIRLRMPPYVKIVLGNPFPRSHITTHLTRTAGLYFGPFRSRASAERFESQFLDLFQMRRCQEDLLPSPEHPGCIYGEMGMCLRMPPYLKIVLGNQFPRSHITTHLTRTAGLYFGPFRSRASAERFESQFLDLFQMRRCQEDLLPSPEHPGCIYGEMGMCLRPCQEVVGTAEYSHEVNRVVEFLRTDGHSLLDAIGHSRDRLSEEMMFEEAQRQHKRFEKVQEVLKLRDELVRDVDRLNGVAITKSLAPSAVEMWFVRDGHWQEPQRFGFEVEEGKTVSLDRKLRETFAAVTPRKQTVRERQEYLALLARWFYSTWRDGEWLGFDSYGDIPYRKLVHAVSRVAK